MMRTAATVAVMRMRKMRMMIKIMITERMTTII